MAKYKIEPVFTARKVSLIKDVVDITEETHVLPQFYKAMAQDSLKRNRSGAPSAAFDIVRKCVRLTYPDGRVEYVGD